MKNLLHTLKLYYLVTKPGIIRGNVITAIAGYLFASGFDVNLRAFAGLLLGIVCVIASGCVLNNIIDREIDKKMTRTAKRALVTGDISVQSAFIYSGMLGLLGFASLGYTTNALTVLIGIVGLLSYIVLYGYYKRKSTYGTLVGSISGSTSLVAGYCSVSGRVDGTALSLFLVMAIWQMPHFYAIGIYKMKEYKKAGLPIWPVVHGIQSTKKQIFLYIVLYMFSICWMFINDYIGQASFTLILAASCWWLYYAVKGFSEKDSIKYGHQIFGTSLLVLLVFSFLISVDKFLP